MVDKIYRIYGRPVEALEYGNAQAAIQWVRDPSEPVTVSTSITRGGLADTLPTHDRNHDGRITYLDYKFLERSQRRGMPLAENRFAQMHRFQAMTPALRQYGLLSLPVEARIARLLGWPDMPRSCTFSYQPAGSTHQGVIQISGVDPQGRSVLIEIMDRNNGIMAIGTIGGYGSIVDMGDRPNTSYDRSGRTPPPTRPEEETPSWPSREVSRSTFERLLSWISQASVPRHAHRHPPSRVSPQIISRR